MQINGVSILYSSNQGRCLLFGNYMVEMKRGYSMCISMIYMALKNRTMIHITFDIPTTLNDSNKDVHSFHSYFIQYWTQKTMKMYSTAQR